MHEPTGARGFRAFPLAGSPAGRLHEETTRRLASGRLPRCPHPEEPAFWHLSVEVLACAACTDRLAGDGEAGAAALCHACGGPASAVAAWVVGGVPCLARLCEPCHATSLVPVTPN